MSPCLPSGRVSCSGGENRIEPDLGACCQLVLRAALPLADAEPVPGGQTSFRRRARLFEVVGRDFSRAKWPRFGPTVSLENRSSWPLAGFAAGVASIVEDRASAKRRRQLALAGDGLVHVGVWVDAPARFRAAKRSRRAMPSSFSVASQLRRVERAAEHRNRLVVDAKRHWERMAVFAAVSEREPRGVVETRRRAVHDLGDQRERLKRPGTELLEQQERREVAQDRARAPVRARRRGGAR